MVGRVERDNGIGRCGVLPSGSVPVRQCTPRSADVAQASAAAPPSTIRQDWNVATIFALQTNESGSTSVLLWPGGVLTASTPTE